LSAPTPSWLVLGSLLLAGPVHAGEPTLEAELLDAGCLRIQGRGFAPSEVELSVKPLESGSAPGCEPAHQERLRPRKGGFDITRELEGCTLECGKGPYSWWVVARDASGTEVAWTELLGCYSGPPEEPEARMRKAWKQLHPGRLLPPVCLHEDPLQVLEADVDSTPGVETVMASRRYGVLLFAAGQPSRALAWQELHCGEWRYSPEEENPWAVGLQAVRASGLTASDLLVRVRHGGRCGGERLVRLLQRRGRTFQTLFERVESSLHQCGASAETRTAARLAFPKVGEIQVTWEDTVREPVEGGDFGPPQTTQGVETWRLVKGRFEKAR
jgi:hypothetical protein